MKFLNFNRVLCLSPHPDDVEYSMSATILKHNQTQFDILCLTQGGDCDKTTNSTRLIEMSDAWKVSNAQNYTIYFSDLKLFKDRDIDQWIKYIEDNYTSINDYDCIMTTSDHDSHFEHVLVSTLAYPISRIKPYSIIQYRSPSTLETWIPNMFISINDFLETKKLMINQFKSQIDKPYFSDEILNGFHTNFQCMKKGLGYIESFKILTMYA